MAANLAIRLRRHLLAIGGSEVVVRPDTYLLDVVNRGQLFENAHPRIVRGLPNQCHYNAVRPHESLGYRPPAPEVFLPALAAWPSARLGGAPTATLPQTSKAGLN